MRNLFLIFATIFVAFTLNSCEYMCLDAATSTGEGDCSQTFTRVTTSTNYQNWADDITRYDEATRFCYMNVFTGMTYTKPDNAHIKLVAGHTSYHTEGINGTKVKDSGYNTDNWNEMCDLDLLPENRGGAPTGTATGETSSAAQGMRVCIYFKAEGKYGMVWYKRGAHGLNSTGKWQILDYEIVHQ